MAILNKVQRGQSISADLINNIIDSVRECQLQSVVGGFFKRGPGGTTITVPPSKGGASSKGPWDIIATAPTSGTGVDLTVIAGTLNGILPSNYDQEFNVATSGLFYAKAVISTDGKNISSVSIAIDGTSPATQEAQEFAIESSIEYLFGVIADGSPHRVIAEGHIEAYTYMWLLATADAPVLAGESPYKIYYILQ
jgi:hypothetical protein